MSNPNPKSCPLCGAPIPPNAEGRLCPACLLSGALKTSDDGTVLMSEDPVPTVPEPRAFPCPFGPYQLLGLLGSGGMGTVYDAEESATGRRVALKTLGRKLDTPELRKRFLREGRLAAGISHPNSLYIYGSQEVDGIPVITMEIAGGGTLQDQLDRNGPLPIDRAVDAVLDVIAGLSAAQAAGVLHRDVKPSNCFVDPTGTVKVGDYGLSVSTAAQDDTYATAAGMVMGTPAFASPEQLRGDDLDVRADIYSVGATLYALLTNRAPFEGANAVQVVANAVNQAPDPVERSRDDIPSDLSRVVARCLAKEPAGRYADYAALRDVLLPFSSKVPAPASIAIRASAGWIDYLLAFLPPYLALMLLVGAEGLFVQPLVDRTLYAWRFYLLLLGIGFLYFAVVEGIWGAGPGKRLKGLKVIRPNGRPPGFARALVRIGIPILCAEGVRLPLMLALISEAEWTTMQTVLFVLAAVGCGWIPVVLALGARGANGYATLWDRASGTRVVVKTRAAIRPTLGGIVQEDNPGLDAEPLGPYRVLREQVPGQWIVADDPALRRRVWLIRGKSSALTPERKSVARPGRLRWLQTVRGGEDVWEAFEAPGGLPLSRLVENGNRISWSTMRHWLHDLAMELYEGSRDRTLPETVCLNQVWITKEGRAVLLDRPWPDGATPPNGVSVQDLDGQQRFLDTVAALVEPTGLPLHARPVLRNLHQARFEKLSFLTGTLRGLLTKPVEVSRGIRAGSMFLLPLYTWIAVVVGYYHDKPWDGSLGRGILGSAFLVLGVVAGLQLLQVPLRRTAGQSIFRLAVVDAHGEPASARRRLARWAVAWLPLLVPSLIIVTTVGWKPGDPDWFAPSFALLVLWLGGAVYGVWSPHRGLPDRAVDTWVVRQ